MGIAEALVGMAEGAAFVMLLLGFRRRRRHKPREVKPVCGCQHHLSYHDPETGMCHGKNYIEGSRFQYGTARYSDCTCRKYSGPEPISEFYAPELGP